MISANRKLVMTTAWTLTVLGAWSIAQRAVQAEEVRPKHEVRVELKLSSAPFLSQLPFIGELFVNATKKESACCVEGQCAQEFERIGIDFSEPGNKLGLNLNEQGNKLQCAHEESTASCELCTVDCANCPAKAQVATATQAACKGCLAASCPSELSQCCRQSECVVETKVANANCCGESECQKHTLAFTSHMTELVAENVALEMALEAKEELFQLQAKMWEQYAALMTEKIQLQEKLSFSEKLIAERESNWHKMQQLSEENSRLKNMVEIAAMRQKVENSKTELVQENERLKLRVAELDVTGDAQQAGVRVAKKPRATKKAE